MDEPTKQIVLSDGRVAVMRRPRGKDLIAANRVSPKIGDPFSFTYALLAQVVMIDGKPVVAEDIAQMYASDTDLLAAEANKSDFLESSSRTSQPSSKEA